MAVNVGTVVLDVRADTQRLVQGMNNAQRATRNAVNSIKKTVATLAGIFVAGNLIGNIKKVGDGLDRIGKVASKLNISTEKLQELHFMAELTGVSIESLNTGLQRMTRRISEASNGTGEASNALKELGLDAKKLNFLNSTQQLEALADAFKNVANDNDKLRLAIKIFDTEGAGFVNFLREGSDGIKKFGLEAKEAGIIVKDEMIRDIEASNDAMFKFNKIIDNVSIGIRTGFSEAILDGSDKANEFAKTFGDIETISKTVKKAIDNVTKTFNVFTNSIQLATQGWALLWATLNDDDENISRLRKEIELTKKAIKGETEALWENIQATDAFKKARETFTGETQFGTIGLDDLEEAEKDIKRFQEKVNKSFGTMAFGISNTFRQTKDSIKETFNSDLLNNITDTVTQSVDKTKEKMKEIQDFSNKTKQTLEDGFTGAFEDIMEGTFSLKDTLGKIFKSIISEMIRVFIVRQALNGIFGGSGGFGGGFAKGGAFNNGVQAFAKGGVVDTPTTFPMQGQKTGLMGEAGAEAIVPLKRTASGELGVQQSPVNVQVINNNSSDVSVSQEGDQLKIIIDSVENAISSGITRGTSPVAQSIQTMKKQGRL